MRLKYYIQDIELILKYWKPKKMLTRANVFAYLGIKTNFSFDAQNPIKLSLKRIILDLFVCNLNRLISQNDILFLDLF